jgi:hypothetical protein
MPELSCLAFLLLQPVLEGQKARPLLAVNLEKNS